MLKLGIIGTSMISHAFISACQLTNHYQLAAVYSRRLETAEKFASPYGQVALFTDLNDFVQSHVDVIYIASPNALHYSQAKLALLAGKHVIIEKPMVSTPLEFEALHLIARENQCFIFEAARNYHELAMAVIRDFLRDKQVWGAHLTYAKYSSKMPSLLAGEIPNIFSSQMSAGALMDLGIYCIYGAVRLLGKPNSASYMAQQLPNAVDLNGTGTLNYGDFLVTITAGKNISSQLSSEIYLSDGTLVLDGINNVSSAIFYGHDGRKTVLDLPKSEHGMSDEAQAFARVLKNPMEMTNLADYEKWTFDARTVHETLYQMRQSANIIFEADKK